MRDDRRIVNQLRALGGLLAIEDAVDVVAYTATAAEVSAALKKHTPYMIVATSDFHVRRGAFGATTAVAATDMYFPADTVIVLWTGESTSFSFVQDSAGGSAYVCEVMVDTGPVPTAADAQYAG